MGSYTPPAASAPTLIYQYTVPADGYAANGNLLSYTDTVMGTWNFGYDGLDRLVTATGTSDNQNLCWAYDSFGNRLQQASSNVAFIWTPENCTTAGTLYQNVWSSFDDNNHVAQTNASGSLVMNTPQTPVYDGGGNVINDGSNQYLYDSENRICAVSSYAGMTGYIYDAEGNRTAKGTLSSWSCPTATNFTLATAYVVGASGEQLTEIGAAGDWHHTNVWAGGKLIATYNTGGLHFHIDDPLGTRRAQTNRDGQLEATYQSLPYGDGYSATYAQNVVDDPTENHFTAKERDAESGNDYMFARYYNSVTGRFLSPDWSVKHEPVPYAKLEDPQSLNLFVYASNSPLIRLDVDGHCPFCAEVGEVAVQAARGGAIGAMANVGITWLFNPNATKDDYVGAAKSGFITGAVAGATNGESLGIQVLMNSTANVFGGIVERSTAAGHLDIGSRSDILTDAAIGAAGPLLSAAGSKVLGPGKNAATLTKESRGKHLGARHKLSLESQAAAASALDETARSIGDRAAKIIDEANRAFDDMQKSDEKRDRQ